MTPTASDIVMFVTTHGYSTTSINYVQKVLDSHPKDSSSETLAHIAAEAQAALAGDAK
jgi:hypothetical protein